MGRIGSREPSGAASDATAAVVGAKLAAGLLGWPCAFVALGRGDTVDLLEQHGDLPLDRAAFVSIAAFVAARGRTVVTRLTPGASEPPDRCPLPPGVTRMVAAPLISDDGDTIGVVGGLDNGDGVIDPATSDALDDLAALLGLTVISQLRLARREAEATAASERADAAERRETRLRAALDSLPHFFWVTDAAGRYVEQNAWDREAFGDLTGGTAAGADLPLQTKAFWQERHRRVLGGETLRFASWRHHPGSEGERWVESVMAPLIVDGAIEGLVGLTVDRTEQAVMAERLAASEAWLRTAIDALPCALVICDAQGRHVMQNRVDRELWGDAIGKTVAETDVPAEAKAHIPGVIARVLEGQTVRETRHYHDHGERRDIEEIYAPVQTEQGIIGFVGLAIDNTDRAAAERRLRASEARFRAAIDALPCGLFICDLDGRHLIQNRVDRQEWGDLVGKTCDEVELPPVIMDWVPEVLAKIPAGETLRCEMTYERHGRSVAVEKIYAPVEEDGVVTSYVSLTIDHTDRASAERRLAEAKARLRAAIDALPFPFFICDLDGRHLLQNRVDRELWGDCIGKTFAETGLPPELIDHVPAAIERVRQGQTVHNPLAYERGAKHHYEEEVYAPVQIDGAIAGFVGLTIDHTLQVENERRLQESEARLADYVDTASDWVWETDAEHRVLALAGLPAKPKLPAESVVGKRRWELVGADPATDPLWRGHLADLDAGRPFRGFVFSLKGLDQSTFWVEINGNPIQDAAGACIGYRGTGRDVTDRVLAERCLKESEARLADYLATASDWLWETDAAHRITSLAGWPPDALFSADRLIGHRRWEFVAVDAASDPQWQDHVRDLEARRPFRGFVYPYSSEDHPEVWIELSGNPVFDAAGTFVGYRGTARDVTARRQAEAAAREAQAKLDAMAQSGLIGMTGGHGFFIEEANDAFLAIVGLERAALEGGLDWRELVPTEDVSTEETAACGLDYTGAVHTTETSYRHSSGTRVPVLLNIVVLDGTKQRWFALVQDLTPMKLAEARVRELAERDGLTGLANRHVLFDRLQGDLAERRRPGERGALLLLDLDRFKAINDSLGHEAGDRLLQIIGARLSAVVRDTDTVARIGGDEFAIVLRGLHGPVVVAQIAEKLLDAVREPLVLDGHLVRPNGSLGISLFPGDGNTPAELLKQADMALYQAKAKGRGSFCFFEPALLAALEDRRRLSEALGSAIGSAAFSVVLQPRIALSDGRHVGLEALARWRLDGAELLPGAFIGLAEETGRMRSLGRHLRRIALEALCRLEAAGLSPGTLALNIAASELKEIDFAASLAAELALHAVPPERIEVEVTENVLLDRDGDRVTASLCELRRLGFTVTLDDFGSGYASLTHLRRLPLDRLKIDRSIVQDIGVDADETVIVRSIINLAHTLGMTVVAEGVETAEQLAFLRLHGCDFAQGYHLAEPLRPAALEAYLMQRAAAESRAELSLQQR